MSVAALSIAAPPISINAKPAIARTMIGDPVDGSFDGSDAEPPVVVVPLVEPSELLVPPVDATATVMGNLSLCVPVVGFGPSTTIV